MPQGPDIDGLLLQWGDRLFFLGKRMVRASQGPKLNARQRAAAIPPRTEATVVKRAPQVLVKVTGGGSGKRAIAVHFRYISKIGRLDMKNERGETLRERQALPESADCPWCNGTGPSAATERGGRSANAN